MERKEIEARLAPCGLDCSRCVRKADGAIAEGARALASCLEGFAARASKMANLAPALAGYPAFEEVLVFLASGDCAGCRSGSGCGLPGCAARTCAAERGLGFCGECADFPCARNAFPPELDAKWRAAGARIAEAGAEAWCREQASKPRY